MQTIEEVFGPPNYDEMDGESLAGAVARALGWTLIPGAFDVMGFWQAPDGNVVAWSKWNPCENWQQAGPIIERENIQLGPPTGPVHRNPGGNGQSGVWSACTWHRGVNGRRAIAHHETSPLIAAMRCFVKSKLM